MHIRRALLFGLLAAAPLRAGQTWRVDDDGPADAPDLDAVQLLAAPGDTVLVEPGLYPPFHLQESLSVVGSTQGERPRFDGPSFVTATDGFVLAGLELTALSVWSVNGPSLLDDCVLRGADALPALEVTGHARLVVQRSRSVGGAAALAGPPPPGLRVQASELVSVDCTWGVAGSAGLFAQASDVWVARSTGAAEFHGSSVDWRTSSSPAQLTAADSQIAYGAANLVSVSATSSQLTASTAAAPMLSLGRASAPGELQTLALYAPLGHVALVGLARRAANNVFPGVEGTAWIDPSALYGIVPLVGRGEGTPAELSFQLPVHPQMVGWTCWLQALLPTVPGALDPSSMSVTNPVAICVRY